MLNTYLEQVQTLSRDAKQDLHDPEDLIRFINLARREVAMRTQCLRVLTPISGSIISATVTAGGSGYTSPTVTISPPDFPSGQGPFPNGDQATASAIVVGGVIIAVTITYGGHGYFQPTVTITDGAGTGAQVTLNLSFINQLSQGQEVYPFSQVSLAPFPGLASVYLIRRASILFSNWRYSTRVYSFSTYNALIRTYPMQYQYTPFYCAQYGRGTAGSFYMYPLPSQAYQMEWDCFCLPQDLLTDLSVEAIPEPFTDAVPYMALYHAYNSIQNWNVARYYKTEFNEWVSRYASYTQPGGAVDAYGGRW
jgi:hypothetical protein